MTFEKAVYFLPSSSYAFHRAPSNRTTAIPSHTHSRHYLSVVSLSISRSPRGAHVLANPNRHARSFVGGSQLFRAFPYALCMLETPERLATRHHGPPSRCPLEHTKTTKKCRAPSSEAHRDARRNFAEFRPNNMGGFFTKRHCWLGGNS